METMGHCPTLEFHVDASLAEAQCAAVGAPCEACSATPEQEAASAAWGKGRRPAQFAQLDSFVVGPNNRLALASAEIAFRSPGQFTPLVICGPTSVGKTHLLQGIAVAARRLRPAIRALYLSAEQFTSSFLEALRGSGMPSFRRKYRGVELFSLDDLQFLSGQAGDAGGIAPHDRRIARACGGNWSLRPIGRRRN